MSATGPILDSQPPPRPVAAGNVPRRRAVPWGLLGMLGLMVVIENIVARDVLDFSDPVSLSWRLAARSARDEAPRCSVLCAGDSLVKHGLIPKVITARSGLASVNLAVARGPAPATFFLVRRALEAGARPAALVVDFKPNVLVGGPRYNVRYWQEILTFRESLDLARSAGSGPLFFELAVGICCRRSGRGTRSGATCGRPCAARSIRSVRSIAPASGTGRSTTVPTSRPRTPPSTASSEPTTTRSTRPRPFDRHRINAEYIRRLLHPGRRAGRPGLLASAATGPPAPGPPRANRGRGGLRPVCPLLPDTYSQPDRPRRSPCRLRSHTLRRPDPPRRPGGLYPQPRRGRHPPPGPRRRGLAKRSAGSTCPPTTPVPSRWPSRISNNRGGPCSRRVRRPGAERSIAQGLAPPERRRLSCPPERGRAVAARLRARGLR